MPAMPPYTRQLYLKPGELCVPFDATFVETVLGSCVAVSFYCPIQRVGAICHAMLPSGAQGNYKYIDAAVDYMLATLKARGIPMATVVAKLFGGADMLFPTRDGHRAKSVIGQQNILMAQHILKQQHIQILKQDVGGFHGRKLLFFSATGQVFIKKLDKTVRQIG